MSLESLYNNVLNGNIEFIGNTLGLSKALDSQDMGTADAIGAFISTNTDLTVPTYPPGTTLNISENSSSAVLNLPSGSEVQFAYLIWGGTYKVPGVDLGNNVSNKINFTVPNSLTYHPISADKTNFANPSSTVGLYSHIADVTRYVAPGGNGTYTVSEIAGTTSPYNNVYNCCGWTLVVIYENPELYDSSYINFYYGIEYINSSGTYETNFTDFQTQPSPIANTARFLVSAMQASANVKGDQVLLGPTASNLKALAGPNNPANNFFGSQINGNNGYIDTSGTFGTRNHDVLTATNIPGGRQGWDITNINIQPNITNSQTQATLKFQSSHDTYCPNAFALVTTVKSPIINIGTVNASKYIVGSSDDKFQISIGITNLGKVAATNLRISFHLPYGLKGVPPLINNGLYDSNASINSPIFVPRLQAGEFQSMSGFCQPYDTPANNANHYEIYVSISYEFPNPLGGNYTGEKSSTITTIYSAPVNISKTASKDFVNPTGDTMQYTINVKNTSNVNINNVLITDLLPRELSFSSNSVSVDGTNNSDNIVTTGVSLGTMTPNQNHKILFTANVNTNPPYDQYYKNLAKIAYQATFDSAPYNNEYTSSPCYTSPSVIVKINKIANKIMVIPGKDTVEYTISVINSPSNLVQTYMTDIVLTDLLPNGLSYKANTLTINGMHSSDSPTTGITIPDLYYCVSATITFIANVNTKPTTGVEYVNQATLNYKFEYAGIKKSDTINSNSNTIYSSDIVPKPTLNLTSNVTSVMLGNTIEYTATITNNNATGIENATFNNKLPNGLSFIVGTLTINDTSNSATSLESNIPLGNITKGNTVVVKYSARVQSVPNDGKTYTNTFTLNYDSESIAGKLNYTVTSNINTVAINIPIRATVILSANKTYVTSIGDTIEYTATISNPNTNTNTNPIYNVVLSNSLPSTLSFKSGSITIKDVPSNDSISNVSVGTIDHGANTIIKFTAIVKAEPTVGNTYTNFVNVKYKFQNALGENRTSVISNSIVTYSPSIIIRPTLNLKTNKYFVVPGDTISFTDTITNNTHTPIINSTFSAQLPKGLSFVSNSLTINNTPYADSNFNKPINLGALNVGSSILLKYSAKITSTSSNSGIYSNFFNVYYLFDSPVGNLTNSINSNTVNLATNNTTINPLAFKNMIYETTKNTPLVEKIIFANIFSNTLSYSIQTYPSNGYAAINEKGIFKYTPKVNFLGEDKFSILINNADIGSITLDINIIVVTNLINLLKEFPYC